MERSLEICRRATTVEHLRTLLMEALCEVYGYTNTTFLSGDTFRRAFSDPEPVTTGRITPILDEYQARWRQDDMFSLPRSYALLKAEPALSSEQLYGMPAPAREYMNGFLERHGLRSASVLHIDLPARWHGLVGIFDDEGKQPAPGTLAGLAALAEKLSELALTLPMSRSHRWDARLSPRLREVADMVIEGFTNEEISEALVLSPESVKTYVSRVLTATETRNRSELVRVASS